MGAGSLISYLRRHGRKLSPLLILTHDHPDPDAIASAFGLQHLARVLGNVRSRIAYAGVIGRVENRTMVKLLEIPVHSLRAGLDFKRYRNLSLVDTQPDFENNPVPGGMKVDLVVDHHPKVPSRRLRRSFIVPQAGATSVILAQALFRLKVPIPYRLATSLAYGILSETQDLGRDARDLDIRVYKELLPWCDMKLLALIQNPPKAKEFFRVLNRSLDNAFVIREVIGVHLGLLDTPDWISQTADFLLTYEEVRWAICTGRFQNNLHVSLRALKPRAHAGKLLRRAMGTKEGAGGHRSIAGGALALTPPVNEAQWRRAEGQVVQGLLRCLYKGRTPRLRFPFRVR